MASFRERWRALLVGLLAVGLGAAIHGLFHALAPADARPVPSLAAIPWLLAVVGVAAFLASAVTVARRQRSLGRKLGVALGHALLGMAGLAGVLASDPAFPFGPHYAESMTLPGDRGTAYLYRGGLFCRQSVWRAARDYVGLLRG